MTHIDRHSIAQALHVLEAGGVLLFPTETVFALAASPFRADAIEGISQLKSRAPSKHYAMLFPTLSMIDDYCPIPEAHRPLMTQHMPGPLTCIVPLRLPSPFAAPLDGYTTLGVRIPDHPLAMALLQAWGKPLVATSANRSGQDNSTDCTVILNELCGTVDAILQDDAHAPAGIASTIVDMTKESPVIVRQGSLYL